MAYDENLRYLTTLKAGADLSAKQFYLVKLDSSGDVVLTSVVNEDCIGILQNKPASGERALVAQLSAGGISKLVVDGNSVNISIGDNVAASATGTGVKDASPTTDDVIIGQALEAAAADGLTIAVLLNRRTLAP